MAKKSTKSKSKTLKRKSTSFNKKEFSLFVAIFAAVGAFTLWVSFAAPHNGGGGGSGGGYSSSLALTMTADQNSDGLPNFGDIITLVPTTTFVDPNGNGPWLSLTCSQNGTVVYSASTGYGPNYPWPWTKQMTLKSGAWTSGAADCSSKLYYYTGKKYPTLATLSFHVNP
jgi:hypothetical protein